MATRIRVIRADRTGNFGAPGAGPFKLIVFIELTRNDERENHVLLITVINPAYPITCVS